MWLPGFLGSFYGFFPFFFRSSFWFLVFFSFLLFAFLTFYYYLGVWFVSLFIYVSSLVAHSLLPASVPLPLHSTFNRVSMWAFELWASSFELMLKETTCKRPGANQRTRCRSRFRRLAHFWGRVSGERQRIKRKERLSEKKRRQYVVNPAHLLARKRSHTPLSLRWQALTGCALREECTEEE